MGIVPDKIINMNIAKQSTTTRIKNNLLAANSPLYGPELDEVADQSVEEYNLHMRGVRSAF